MNFCSRIELARAIPEMYSGFGARMRSSQMDVDGAFAKLEQKKPSEIQWSTNHHSLMKTCLLKSTGWLLVGHAIVSDATGRDIEHMSSVH